MVRQLMAMAAMLLAAAAGAQPVLAEQQEADALGTRQVYVVRHLQKARGDDPPLTEEGATLARSLAVQLGNSGIKAVFATPTRRATQTGEPLAGLLGIPVTHYDPGDVQGLVGEVEAVAGNVLVVGHSNTVPDLVAAFGGTRPEPLTERDYGTIYQVRLGSPEVRSFHVPPAPMPALTGTERER